MQFQRVISPVSLLFAGISSVIGSGWLFGPLYTAQIAGPAAVISWIVGGFLMIIIALTFAELGTTFPVAGGMIQYAQYSHGPLMSFMIGWMVWISSIAVAPVETIGLLQYAANYIPGLVEISENVHVLTHKGMLYAAVIMLFMCTLNYYGAQFFSHSNFVITLIKLIVPITTVFVLIGYAFNSANFHSLQGGFAPYGWHGILSALPLGGVIYSFIGSNTILQLAGESRNPKISIPLALIGTMVFCTILYSLLQVAFIGALTPSDIAQGWNKLHYPGDSGPFAGIAAALGFGWFATIIYADAMISPFGTGFVFTASTARVSYGLSEIGFFPKSLKILNQRGIPLRCIILNFFAGLLLLLPFPGWQKLATFIISCFIVSYIIGPISLVTLRRLRPDEHRPFILPYAMFVALIAFYICNLLIFWTGWQTVYKMMIAFTLGFIFFIIYCFREPDKNLLSHWYRAWWIFPYFILLGLISYCGSFGNGLNLIPFGIDFVVIAVLTIVIFYCSLYSSKHLHEVKQ